MFEGKSILRSWILCAVFVIAAFGCLATPGSATTGEVSFESPSGVQVDYYFLPSTMYIHLTGSSIEVGLIYAYMLRDPNGLIVETTDYGSFDIDIIETYTLTSSSPTGTWTAYLKTFDEYSGRYATIAGDTVVVSAAALPDIKAYDLHADPSPAINTHSLTIGCSIQTGYVPFTQTIVTQLIIDSEVVASWTLAGSSTATTYTYSYTTHASFGMTVEMFTDATLAVNEVVESNNRLTIYPDVLAEGTTEILSDTYYIPGTMSIGLNLYHGDTSEGKFYLKLKDSIDIQKYYQEWLTFDDWTVAWVTYDFSTGDLGGTWTASLYWYCYSTGTNYLMASDTANVISYAYSGVPLLTAPSNGATGVLVDAYLIWDPPDNSDASKIEITTGSTTTTHFTDLNYYMCALSYSTSYSWRVAASPDSGSTYGPWSTTWTFTTVNAPTEIVPVVYPRTPTDFYDTSGGYAPEPIDGALSSAYATFSTSSNSVQVGTAAGSAVVPRLADTDDSEASAQARVWKTIEIGKSTRYSVLASGEYNAILQAAAWLVGYCESEVWFYFDIEDTNGNFLVHQLILYDRIEAQVVPTPASDNVAEWEVNVMFDGVKGMQYRIGVSAYARSYATSLIAGVATTTMDAVANSDWTWNDHYGGGLSIDHFIVFTPTIGCIAEGTMITMADGSEKPVDDVAKGDFVLGYDPETGVYVSQIVVDLAKARVDVVLYINNGDLITTVNHQPIYVRNGTWTGWVTDPVSLRVGWEIFRPAEGEWIVIIDLDVSIENMWVYDFTTDGYQTYLGNGFLLLDKAIPVH